MAVVSFMDADQFDVTKSYYNKLKSKEEICYIVLTNYRNQPINETVKGVVVDPNIDVKEIVQGVVYYKMLDYTDEPKELKEFLEELIDPADIYTYVVKLGENYNDLRVLTQLVSKYSDSKLRFIGGNLLALDGAGVGFFSDAFINQYKLKTKATIRFDFTQVKLIDSSNLVVRGIEEFSARKTQVKKSKVVKQRANSKPSRTKSVSRKRNVMDILGSY